MCESYWTINRFSLSRDALCSFALKSQYLSLSLAQQRTYCQVPSFLGAGQSDFVVTSFTRLAKWTRIDASTSH